MPIKNEDDEVLYYDYYSCNNPEYFADSVPIPWDENNNTAQSKYWNKIIRYENLITSDIYDFNGGYGFLSDEFCCKYMLIGNTGELLPQMWHSEPEKYFVNMVTVNDKHTDINSSVCTFCKYDDNAPKFIGFGNIQFNTEIGESNRGLGFRCFNIIKDDGTVI